MNTERTYTVANEFGTSIGIFTEYKEAADVAQQYADRHASTVTMLWLDDEGDTHRETFESEATAAVLEEWIMNNGKVYEERFLPIARSTERRFQKYGVDRAHEHARKGTLPMVEYAVHAFDWERSKYGGHFMNFATDKIRECVDSIAWGIICDLEDGESFF